MGILALTGRPTSLDGILGGIVLSSISYSSANADTALNNVQDIVLMMNPYQIKIGNSLPREILSKNTFTLSHDGLLHENKRDNREVPPT